MDGDSGRRDKEGFLLWRLLQEEIDGFNQMFSVWEVLNKLEFRVHGVSVRAEDAGSLFNLGGGDWEALSCSLFSLNVGTLAWSTVGCGGISIISGWFIVSGGGLVISGGLVLGGVNDWIFNGIISGGLVLGSVNSWVLHSVISGSLVLRSVNGWIFNGVICCGLVLGSVNDWFVNSVGSGGVACIWEIRSWDIGSLVVLVGVDALPELLGIIESVSWDEIVFLQGIEDSALSVGFWSSSNIGFKMRSKLTTEFWTLALDIFVDFNEDTLSQSTEVVIEWSIGGGSIGGSVCSRLIASCSGI